MATKEAIHLRCCICGKKSVTRAYRKQFQATLRDIKGKLCAWQVCSHRCLEEANRGYPVTPDRYEFKAAARGFALKP